MREKEGTSRNPFLWSHQHGHACVPVSWKKNLLLVLIIMLAFVWHFAVYAVFTVLLNPLSLLIVCCGRWKEWEGEQGSWLLWGLSTLSLCFSRSGALQGGWCYSKWAPTSHLVRLCSRGQCLPVSRLPLEPPTCLSTLLVRMPYFQPGSSFLFLLKAWLDFATGSAEVWVLSRACG